MPSTFQSVIEEFIFEYAWHARNCAAINADGEWHKGNPECDCGFDKAREHVLFLTERLRDLEKI
jgi:hypothetical protein